MSGNPDILSWQDVTEFHRTVAGIYIQGGEVISILCNQNKGAAHGKSGRYGDVVGEDRLTYYVGRMTQTHTVERLFDRFKTPRPVRVYEKLGINKWRDLGWWMPDVIGDASGDGTIPFYFVRAAAP